MTSAEEAAYLNALYRSQNGLPVDPNNSQILASQNGLNYVWAQQQQDAQLEQQKHDTAFSQPRDDTQVAHSAAYNAIVSQYQQQHSNTVSSGGTYQQPSNEPTPQNPYPADTAAGIAWDVARTGGATDLRMNRIAKAEVLASGGNPDFIRYASDIYVERPAYPREDLVTKSGMRFTNEAWAGVPIRLNLTEKEMAGGAGINSDNYRKYLQYNPDTFQLNPVGNNGVNINVDTGVHTRFGDFGGPILKGNSYGGWTGNGSLSGEGRLVGGNKVAGVGALTDLTFEEKWNNARAYGGFVDTTIITDLPTGDIFGFNVPFVSPAIAAFQQGKTTTIEKTTTTDSVMTNTTVATVPSAFDAGINKVDTYLSNTEKSISGLLWGNNKPQISTEQIKESSSWFALNPGTLPFAIALKTPVLQDYAASYLKGEAQGYIDKPVQSAAAFGMGLGFGAIFKGVEYGYEGSRASFAAKAISEGGGWRSAEMYAANVPKISGAVLGSLYAADVGMRTTNMGTDFSPKAAERFGGIVATEARPMTAGAVLGYAAPGKIYDTVKLSDVGYKSNLQEGYTTGRFDYYVKQPVTKPVELLKQDYSAFKQDGGTSKLTYVAEKTGLNYVPSPEPITLKYSPAQNPTGFQSEVAYGKQNTIFDYFTKGTYETPTTLKYTPAQTGEIAQVAYGNVKSPFRTAYDVMNAATTKGMQTEPSRMFFTEKTSNTLSQKVYSQETLRMRYDAYVQENPNIVRDFKTNWQNPAKEISDYNKMYSLSKTTSGSGTGASSVNVKSPFGSFPSAARISTKVVGGKTVSGLAKEPSLKSLGRTEPSGGTTGKLGFATRHATDFRGAPTSATMKPMDLSKVKQSSGSLAIMSEPLPMPEGMTVGKNMPQQQRSSGIVGVVQPELLFDIEQKQNRMLAVSPQFSLGSIQMFDVSQKRVSAQTVAQEQKKSLGFVQMQNIGQERIQTSRQKKNAMERLANVDVMSQSDYARARDSATRSAIDQTRTPDYSVRFTNHQDVRKGQTQESRQIPYQEKITVPKPPEEIIPKIPDAPYIPAGGSGYGQRRAPRIFTELLPIGLDISTFGGRTRVRGNTKPKKTSVSKALSVKRKKK